MKQARFPRVPSGMSRIFEQTSCFSMVCLVYETPCPLDRAYNIFIIKCHFSNSLLSTYPKHNVVYPKVTPRAMLFSATTFFLP